MNWKDMPLWLAICLLARELRMTPWDLLELDADIVYEWLEVFL